ncbi:MAG: hypothetical protein CSA89_00795 [Bacteroidales bacterium]|nr:MAG: hypothetical protein CSA89_00795 [Bacteroidales bacterium]
MTYKQHSDADFKVFVHHIYEYQKGLRNLVLHTMSATAKEEVVGYLLRKKIAFHINEVSKNRINVFFGDVRCVNIVKSFNFSSLTHLTDEQDFILGIMLGYDQRLQCERFLKRKSMFTVRQQDESIHKICV